MCGRFTLTTESIVITERFDVPFKDIEWQLRYNIAPSQSCLTVIMKNNQRELISMSWGLIPHWEKDKKSSYQMINARVETVKNKTSFRELFKSRRCLVPADGFYEWKKNVAKKIPYRIALRSSKLFSFAGLRDEWHGENGEEIKSFTILTSDSNALISKLHHRMPIILKKENEALWLDPNLQNEAILDELLQPYSVNEMTLYEVSDFVNSWKNDNFKCIQPV
jgi:putative SOS response-associated peptidase YedK